MLRLNRDCVTLRLVSLLALTGWLAYTAPSARAQRWQEEPGRLEFTGTMVARPLQVEHWIERGYTEQQAQERYNQAVDYTVRTLGGHVYRYYARMDEYWFDVPEGRTENDIGVELISTGYYRYVCPNWRATPSASSLGAAMLNECPDDPLISNQWHHDRIESCAGWQIHTAGHDDVVIGFIDAGLRVTHEDVSTLSQNRRQGFNLYEGCWEAPGCEIPDAFACHGTRVLSAGAATGDNGVGISGIGWSLRHRMLNGVGQLQECLDCMWVSAGAGDRVICSTWGGRFDDPDIWQAFADNTEAMFMVDQFDPEPIIFQSAQNVASLQYAPFPYMTVVGGTQQDDTRWYDAELAGSPAGEFIDIMAPAADIYTARCNTDQAYGTPLSGTSYAVPQAAGLAALLWSYDPSFERDEVLDFLYRGCDPIVNYDPDLHGAGRINVFNSLALASGALWTRTPHPGDAGETNYFKGAGADEGSTVWFYYGTGVGQTQVTAGNCMITLDIANAALLPDESAVATSNGAAILDQVVPGGWSGQSVWLQVVEEENCRKSNIVEFEFE